MVAWVVANLNGSGGFTSTEKAVALAVADLAQVKDGHSCYPSAETIADRACCSVRSAQNALKSLSETVWDEEGEIMRRPVLSIEHGAGRGNHNVYRFAHIAVNDADSAPFEEPKRCKKSDEMVQNPRLNGAKSANLSIYERSFNADIEASSGLSPFQAELENIVGYRPATKREVKLFEEFRGTEKGRAVLWFALQRLREAWPLNYPDDASSYLRSVIEDPKSLSKALPGSGYGRRSNGAETAPSPAAKSDEYATADSGGDTGKAALEADIKAFFARQQAEASRVLESQEEWWGKALDAIQMIVEKGTFQTYFSGTKAISLDGECIVVETPSRYALDWLQGRYQEQANRQVRQVAGEKYSVKFVHNQAHPAWH